MLLKTVNLNLLPVLRELLRSRSVSGTGRSLGRSPPAISEGLAQLRQTFADPLLVRVQGGMELTPRARELVEPVETACAELERLFAAGIFDPTSTERVFVIAAHDFHVFAAGPDLVRLFQETAPGMRLRFVDLGQDLAAQFAARDVDLVLMPSFHLGGLAPARLVHEPLFEDQTVVMMRAGHPLASLEDVDIGTLARYEHVAFHPNWETLDHRQGIGLLRRHVPVRTRVAQVTLLPFFLIDTDLIALAPERLAQRLGPALGLVYRPIVSEMLIVRSIIAWSPLQDADPAHRWVREQIMDWARRDKDNSTTRRSPTSTAGAERTKTGANSNPSSY